jgi:hypothetical protein
VSASTSDRLYLGDSFRVCRFTTTRNGARGRRETGQLRGRKSNRAHATPWGVEVGAADGVGWGREVGCCGIADKREPRGSTSKPAMGGVVRGVDRET